MVTLVVGLLLASTVVRGALVERAGESSSRSITRLLTDSEQHQTFVAALQQAGLLELLNREDGSFTVFAPTNDAFQRMSRELGQPVSNLLTPEKLQEALLYHVVGSQVSLPTFALTHYSATHCHRLSQHPIPPGQKLLAPSSHAEAGGSIGCPLPVAYCQAGSHQAPRSAASRVFGQHKCHSSSTTTAVRPWSDM